MATTLDPFTVPTPTGVNVTANASFDDYYYDYDYDDSVTNIPLTEALPVTFTYALTLALGLIGNVLVIFSIAYYRRMRTTTNVFLFSLASADLLLVLICVPVKAAAFLTFSWRFGMELCKIVNYLQSVSMVCSVLTLATISLERMVAVVAPLKARTMCTKRHALVVVLVVWILSFMLAAPTIFVMHHKEVGFRYKAYWCVKEFSSRPWHIAYEMYMFLLLFLMPMGVMIVTYVIICLKVWRFTGMRADMRSGRVIAPASRERLRQEGPGMDNALLPNTNFMADTRGSRTDRRKQAGNEDTKTTMQLVMMLVIVVVLFAICWAPILVNNLLVAFEVLHPLHYGYLKPMRIAFNVMSYFNSCVNPIVYAFLSKNFRQSFVLAISACVRGQAFVRAYRFSMSIASTRTSAVSNGRLRPGSNFNREKSSSSGNEYTQAVPVTVPEDQLELTALPTTKA